VDVRHCTPTNQIKEELMFALSLKDARNFRQRYLLPAISNKPYQCRNTDYWGMIPSGNNNPPAELSTQL
jgi:hypothetical protein